MYPGDFEEGSDSGLLDDLGHFGGYFSYGEDTSQILDGFTYPERIKDAVDSNSTLNSSLLPQLEAINISLNTGQQASVYNPGESLAPDGRRGGDNPRSTTSVPMHFLINGQHICNYLVNSNDFGSSDDSPLPFLSSNPPPVSPADWPNSSYSGAVTPFYQQCFPVHPSLCDQTPPREGSSGEHSQSAEIAAAHSSSAVVSPQLKIPVTGISRKTYTLKEQQHLFVAAADLSRAYPGPFIPQKMYRPPTRTDRNRYVVDVELLPPVYFWRDSHCGIAVIDILANKAEGLLDPHEPVLAGTSQCISIRLKWPGYHNWSKQVATMDYRKNRTSIPRSKVAKVVAKKIQLFVREVEKGKVGMKTTSDPKKAHRVSKWAIGPNDVRLEDVVLVSFHNVSRGSWQPQLALRA